MSGSTLPGFVAQLVGGEDGDAAAGLSEQAAVGEIVEDLGGGLARGTGEGRELFVGQGDLRVAGTGPRRGPAGRWAAVSVSRVVAMRWANS
jgi:hypothetical protein